MSRWAWFGVAAVASVALAVAAYAVPGHPLLMSASWTVAAATAAVATTFGALRAPAGQRRSWTGVAAGAWAWLLGQIASDVENAVAAPGFPSTADGLWLVAPLLGIWGLYRLTPADGRLRRVLELDALAVLLCVAAVAVAWLYEAAGASSLGLAATVTAVAYVVLYGALALLLLETLAATPALHRQPELCLVLACVLLNGVAWVGYAYDVLAGGYSSGGFRDSFWMAGQLALGAGGLLAARARPIESGDVLTRLRRRTFVPAVGFVTLVGTLIVFGALHRPLGARIALDSGLLVLGLLLVSRNRLATQEADRIRREDRRLIEVRNRELEAFAYSASHDLKAPLVSIQGLAAALARSNADSLDARGRLYLERIGANATTMHRLIGDLFEFARVGVDESAEAIDADRLAREVLDEVDERARAEGAALELLTPIPRLHAHPVRFKQALTNLIDNALRYGRSDARATVRVFARRTGTAVEVVVEDDGPGVAARDRDRMFELFSRGGAAQGLSPDGSGLGLALVQKIAVSSGGSIRYEDAPTGARFVLTFPEGA